VSKRTGILVAAVAVICIAVGVVIGLVVSSSSSAPPVAAVTTRAPVVDDENVGCIQQPSQADFQAMNIVVASYNGNIDAIVPADPTLQGFVPPSRITKLCVVEIDPNTGLFVEHFYGPSDGLTLQQWRVFSVVQSEGWIFGNSAKIVARGNLDPFQSYTVRGYRYVRKASGGIYTPFVSYPDGSILLQNPLDPPDILGEVQYAQDPPQVYVPTKPGRAPTHAAAFGTASPATKASQQAPRPTTVVKPTTQARPSAVPTRAPLTVAAKATGTPTAQSAQLQSYAKAVAAPTVNPNTQVVVTASTVKAKPAGSVMTQKRVAVAPTVSVGKKPR
jgi:hypothetical protein